MDNEGSILLLEEEGFPHSTSCSSLLFVENCYDLFNQQLCMLENDRLVQNGNELASDLISRKRNFPM